MKLLFCSACNDVIRLQKDTRYCVCGNAGGFYEQDGLHAHYWGDQAFPVGFNNSDFVHAVIHQPECGNGFRFEAFVIPKQCPTFEYHHDEIRKTK